MDTNYSYNNIFGGLEYENQYGMMKTDFTMIKPGLLHLANGGYVIFQAKDLLANQVCYEALKKFLRIKEIAIENMVDQRTSMMMVSIKPEPIPLDLKVLIIGSEGRGISKHLLKESDEIVSIPLNGHVNSLNASVAAGVLIYGIK